MTDKQDRGNTLILIIDDDAGHRALARYVLEQAGYAVEEASGAEAGLRVAERARPDLVLLDIMMPEVDGYQVCSALRRNPEFMNLPVLMVTGLDDIESVERAFEAGATHFISKPISWTLLPYHVKYMLRTSWAEDVLGKAKALLEA
jgi:CheY-like chemotaxis protein